MKLGNALVLLVAASLAACGKPPQGQVKFLGFTPNTSIQKDTRALSLHCPGCNMQVAAGVTACPDQKNCKMKIGWAEEYSCGFCNKTGKCSACALMEQEKGQCYNCRGVGYLTFVGKTVECPGCKGKKVCPVCKGDEKCDYCKGEGKVTRPDVESKARKPGTASAEGTPETPAPVTPEEKKP